MALTKMRSNGRSLLHTEWIYFLAVTVNSLHCPVRKKKKKKTKTSVLHAVCSLFPKLSSYPHVCQNVWTRDEVTLFVHAPVGRKQTVALV